MMITIAENVEIIFVDFFDTLVKRSCHPEVVKRKWCASLIDLFSINMELEKLYKLRLSIESHLCNDSVAQGDDAEFRYYDMQIALYNKLIQENASSLPEQSIFITVSKKLELSIELSVQKKIEKIITLLRSEKVKNKKIYLISDFYLDKESIIYFAQHHGFADIFDDVFVSSENKRTKRDGRIYSLVINKLNISPKKAIMLGDNFHSDITMSASFGLLTQHLPFDSSFYNINFKSDTNRYQITKTINQIFEEDKFSFNWLSGAIYLFIRRLYWKLAAKNAQNIYFFAREGEFLKKAFDCYQASLPEGFPHIKSHYMYVSRRATYLPSLGELQTSSFNKFLYQYGSCNLTTFLKSINLEKYIHLLKQRFASVDFDEQYANIAEHPVFNALMQDSEFKTIYDKERHEQNSDLNSYCDSFMSESLNEVIYVVDVGWKGSIQDNLVKATGRKIHGYYLGLFDGSECNDNNTKEGILFDYHKAHIGNLIFNEFRAGFEVFMGASHGSLKCYSPSPTRFVFDNNNEELELYNQFIAPFQTKALEQFEQLIEVEKRYSISDHDISKVIYKQYFYGVLLPKKHEIKKFLSLKHYENFGVFIFSSFNQNKKTPLAYLKKLLRNPKHTIGSAWWKPLDFHINGVGYLKYLYFFIKQAKLSAMKQTEKRLTK